MFERCQNEKHEDAPKECLGISDSRYTMRFDDIGEKPIYWCTPCGIQAKAMDKALEAALQTRPGLFETLRKALDQLKG